MTKDSISVPDGASVVALVFVVESWDPKLKDLGLFLVWGEEGGPALLRDWDAVLEPRDGWLRVAVGWAT